MIGIGAVHRQLARVFGPGSVAGLDEHQLLSRFVDRGDESAFEVILARHGPMVLGVCRRSLDAPDAEDAFQAVFLILVKKARTLQHRDALGPWLYGVARRVASRASKEAARRRRRESPSIAAEHAEAPAVDASLGVERIETRAAIDDALASLPARFRAPMVLCYLEGLTHDEAASRLDIPVGTVRSRLAWARGRLKIKLARRGLVAPASLVMAETIAEAAVSPALVQATLRAALSIAAGQGAAAGVASAASLSLMKGVLTTMMLNKLKVVAVGMLVVGGLAGGGAAAGRQLGGGGMGGNPGTKFGGGHALGDPLRIYQTLSRPLVDPASAGVEIQVAEAEVARATAALDAARARLARAKSARDAAKAAEPKPAERPAADKAGPKIDQAVGPKVGEMQTVVQEGNLIIGFNQDQGRVRVVNLDAKTSKSYQSPGGSKIMPVVSMGGEMVSMYLEGPEIAEVAVYTTSAAAWAVQKLGVPVRGTVWPVFGNGNGRGFAMGVEAPEIREIVAYSASMGSWSIHKLREVAHGSVTPKLHDEATIYRVDRFLYAFSDTTGTWDTLQLADDSPTTVNAMTSNRVGLMQVATPRYTVLQGDLLHAFDPEAGKWSTTSLEEKK